jgi:hypothetical protein
MIDSIAGFLMQEFVVVGIRFQTWIIIILAVFALWILYAWATKH